MKFYIFIIFTLLIFHTVNSTLGPGDKKSKKKEKKNEEVKLKDEKIKANSLKTPVDVPIFDKKLIKTETTIKEIVDNNALISSGKQEKRFGNKVLGYVTPWNSKGYDFSKSFADKFDMISPVWLQIARLGRNKYQLTGTHDIDKKWMQKVREQSNKQLKEFMPRILFEKLKNEDLNALFSSEEEKKSFSEYLVKKADEYGFDGYTFEIYMQLGGHAKYEVSHLVSDLAEALHQNNKKLVIVIPPPVKMRPDSLKESIEARFNKEDFDLLKDKVDYFSLMTYDYPQTIGSVYTNAPLFWVKRNIQYLTSEKKYRAKILVGINFYGYRYEMDLTNKGLLKQPDAVTGNQLIEAIKEDNWIIKYEEKTNEHFFMKQDGTLTLIYFPTLYSIQMKIELANQMGTGLSIWELGQGLDYFFDLF